jgi:hypothetical protein
MSDDETQEIRGEEPTTKVPPEAPVDRQRPTVELPRVETPAASAPTAKIPPARDSRAEVPPAQVPPAQVPPTGAAETGHIRVVSDSPRPAPEVPRPAPEAPAPRPAPERSGLRVGTIVWGIVVAVIGVGLLSLAWGAQLDAQLSLIVLLGAAGVALLVGSLVGLRRSRTREEGPR